ncbi:hypothetical protein RJT34_29018 [Clitoria ternatea]|uniref:Uncharacterized protein n=1 Tax=Clitoria ternatea TaxID=43366 RepID=A0AAN9FEW4_CLITE
MVSIGRNQCILVLLFIATVWPPQVMPRELNEASLLERHGQWMAKYGKTYKDNEEKEKRFKIFKNNVEFIDSFNNAGEKPYKLSTNQFADQTNEEFKASLNGYKRRVNGVLKTTSETSFRYASDAIFPATLDWRKRGAVTPIKSEGACATEGIHEITTGKLVPLSVQELMDCDGKSQGCGGGGSIEDGFEFIVKHGITSEANYPITNNGTCNTQKENSPVAHIKGYEKVPPNNEEALLLAVANQPVSVAIDAGSSGFQFYSSGRNVVAYNLLMLELPNLMLSTQSNIGCKLEARKQLRPLDRNRKSKVTGVYAKTTDKIKWKVFSYNFFLFNFQHRIKIKNFNSVA